MQIVIELSDETYKDIKEENSIYGINNGLSARITGKVVGAIQNGTPLPKGHGRLKDENYFLSILKCEEHETCTWRNCSECNREKCINERHIVSAPTIVEEGKTESEK